MGLSSGSRSGGSGAGPRSLSEILGTAMAGDPSHFLAGLAGNKTNIELLEIAQSLRSHDLFVYDRLLDAFTKAEEIDNAR